MNIKGFFSRIKSVMHSSVISKSLPAVLIAVCFLAGTICDSALASAPLTYIVPMENTGGIQYRDPATGNLINIDYSDYNTLSSALNDLNYDISNINYNIAEYESNVADAKTFKKALVDEALKHGVNVMVTADVGGGAKVSISNVDGNGVFSQDGFDSLESASLYMTADEGTDSPIDQLFSAIYNTGYESGSSIFSDNKYDLDFSSIIVDPNGGLIDGVEHGKEVGYWASNRKTDPVVFQAPSFAGFNVAVEGNHTDEGGRLYDFDGWSIAPVLLTDTNTVDIDGNYDTNLKDSSLNGETGSSMKSKVAAKLNGNWHEHVYNLYFDSDCDGVYDVTKSGKYGDVIDLGEYLDKTHDFNGFDKDLINANCEKKDRGQDNYSFYGDETSAIVVMGDGDLYLTASYKYNLIVDYNSADMENVIRSGVNRGYTEKLSLPIRKKAPNTNTNYVFAGWTIVEGMGALDANGSGWTVTMGPSDFHIQATFIQLTDQQVIEVNKGNSGLGTTITMNYYELNSESQQQQYMRITVIDGAGNKKDDEVFYTVGVSTGESWLYGGDEAVTSGGKKIYRGVRTSDPKFGKNPSIKGVSNAWKNVDNYTSTSNKNVSVVENTSIAGKDPSGGAESIIYLLSKDFYYKTLTNPSGAHSGTTKAVWTGVENCIKQGAKENVLHVTKVTHMKNNWWHGEKSYNVTVGDKPINIKVEMGRYGSDGYGFVDINGKTYMLGTTPSSGVSKNVHSGASETVSITKTLATTKYTISP